jgi:hypothetical protein
MSTGCTTNSISAPSSRRRFLAVAGAASAVSVGVLAAAAMPVPVPQCDAQVVAAGVRFEELFEKYVPAWFDWARLHCEAKEEAEAKFGEENLDSAAWTLPLTGTAPAFLFQLEVSERNGCDNAGALENALAGQMAPFAELIRESEVTSLAGLRAKTLVSVLDFWPSIADHDGNFQFDENSHYSLFAGAVAVTGLSGLVGDLEKRLLANAGATFRDGAPIAA